MTAKIIPVPIPVQTVYIAWAGLEGWNVEPGLQVSASCSVGCGMCVWGAASLSGV